MSCLREVGQGLVLICWYKMFSFPRRLLSTRRSCHDIQLPASPHYFPVAQDPCNEVTRAHP